MSCSIGHNAGQSSSVRGRTLIVMRVRIAATHRSGKPITCGSTSRHPPRAAVLIPRGTDEKRNW
jgi:hypothetical protein